MNDLYYINIIEALEKIKQEPPRNIGGKYHNEICDDEELKRQQKFLMDLITKPNNPVPIIDENGNLIPPPLVIKVVDNDCTFGKTTLSLYAIIKLYNHIFTENWRVIWVADKKEDCNKNAQKLNGLVGFDLAVAITGDISSTKRINYAKNFDVIFITQERYRRLARYYNEEERKFFKYNRQLLIIDEKIQMNRVITFSIARYYELKEEIQKLGGTKAVTIYNEIVKPLVDYIRAKTITDVLKKGIIHQFEENLTNIEKNIEKIKNLIKSKSNNQIRKQSNHSRTATLNRARPEEPLPERDAAGFLEVPHPLPLLVEVQAETLYLHVLLRYACVLLVEEPLEQLDLDGKRRRRSEFRTAFRSGFRSGFGNRFIHASGNGIGIVCEPHNDGIHLLFRQIYRIAATALDLIERSRFELASNALLNGTFGNAETLRQLA